MIVLFKTQNNEEASVDIPFDVSEILFSDFCDYKAAEKVFWESMKAEEKDAQYSAISMLGLVKTIVSGDVDLMPFTFIDDNLETLIETGIDINIGTELSVLRIYAHIVKMINDYEPQDIPKTFRLKWRGGKYVINRAEAAKVLLGDSVTTGEAIEIMEYQRRSLHHIESSPDQSGNIDFSLGLTEFAILVRKPSEKFPHERKKIDEFIAERREVFKDLPLSDVLSVRFFLLNSLMTYAKSQNTNSSGKARKGGLAVVRKLNGKRRKKQNKLGK